MKITDLGAHYSPQFERVEMSNLDKVFERNRITKQGIDAMITNYLRLERELVEAQAEIVRLKGEAESWEKVFDRTCEHLADAKTELAEANVRLDWLDTVECGIRHRSYGEYWHYIGKGFPKAREVIDEAMKEGGK